MRLQDLLFTPNLFLNGIEAHCRNTCIKQFHTWKGLNYVPENLHPAIKWHTQHSYPLQMDQEDTPWQIVN